MNEVNDDFDELLWLYNHGLTVSNKKKYIFLLHSKCFVAEMNEVPLDLLAGVELLAEILDDGNFSLKKDRLGMFFDEASAKMLLNMFVKNAKYIGEIRKRNLNKD